MLVGDSVKVERRGENGGEQYLEGIAHQHTLSSPGWVATLKSMHLIMAGKVQYGLRYKTNLTIFRKNLCQ